MKLNVGLEHIALTITLLGAIMSGTWYLSHKLTAIELSTGVLVVRVDKLEDNYERIFYRDLAGIEHSVVRQLPVSAKTEPRVELRSL